MLPFLPSGKDVTGQDCLATVFQGNSASSCTFPTGRDGRRWARWDLWGTLTGGELITGSLQQLPVSPFVPILPLSGFPLHWRVSLRGCVQGLSLPLCHWLRRKLFLSQDHALATLGVRKNSNFLYCV